MFLSDKPDEQFMAYALREARKAADEGEVPVGAVIVHEGQIIGRGHNRTESLNDPTAHAEILAIGAAAEAIGDWRLRGTTLYVMLEPCFMCAGAIVLARIDRLVFGATDPRAGACVSLADVTNDPRLAHQVEVVHGIGAKEAIGVLQEFFAKRRAEEKGEGPVN